MTDKFPVLKHSPQAQQVDNPGSQDRLLGNQVINDDHSENRKAQDRTDHQSSGRKRSRIRFAYQSAEPTRAATIRRHRLFEITGSEIRPTGLGHVEFSV